MVNILINLIDKINTTSNFVVPDDYSLNATQCGVDENGKNFIYVKGIRWFTNLNLNFGQS